MKASPRGMPLQTSESDGILFVDHPVGSSVLRVTNIVPWNVDVQVVTATESLKGGSVTGKARVILSCRHSSRGFGQPSVRELN
jgi:hypothetical protein